MRKFAVFLVAVGAVNAAAQPPAVVVPAAPVPTGPPSVVVMPAPAPMMVVPTPTPMSLADACCQLKGLPAGQHQLVLIHPHTCCPVTVCFCLPCSCSEVKCSKFLWTHRLKFDCEGHKDVVIKFKKDGTVKVDQ